MNVSPTGNFWKWVAAAFLCTNCIAWGLVLYWWPKQAVAPSTSPDGFAFLNATLSALQSMLALVAIVLAVVGVIGYRAIYDAAVEKSGQAARDVAKEIAIGAKMAADTAAAAASGAATAAASSLEEVDRLLAESKSMLEKAVVEARQAAMDAASKETRRYMDAMQAGATLLQSRSQDKPPRPPDVDRPNSQEDWPE